jgi:hypothetical protein
LAEAWVTRVTGRYRFPADRWEKHRDACRGDAARWLTIAIAQQGGSPVPRAPFDVVETDREPATDATPEYVYVLASVDARHGKAGSS